ncbi:MAG: hypothetical protein Q9222_000784 [Ikaeria aurantiellina]
MYIQIGLFSGQDILASAFSAAKDFLKKELPQREYDSIFETDNAQPRSIHNINTFAATLEQARDAYKNRASSGKGCAKAKIWLASLSARVVHYGNIFDVLVQHHPEYVSLAWGTFKLIFVAVQNHEELISKISKHATRLANLLPQQNALLLLYPTNSMREAVAQQFASLLKFFRLAIQFYKDSRLKHAWKAFVQPWSLAFQDIYDTVATQAEKVKELAALAAKAELRDAHIQIAESRMVSDRMSNDIINLRSTVEQMKGMLDQRMAFHGELLTSIPLPVSKLLQWLMVYHLALYQGVRLDLSQQRESISQIHLNQLLSLPFWQRTPTSGESMEYCDSIRRRRQKRSPTVFPEEKCLKLWAEGSESSLLATQSYYRTTQKDFMVQVIRLLRDSKRPVIWALRYPKYWNADLTIIDLLRMLVLQALQINAARLISTAFPITVPQMREASTQQDWLILLQQATQGLGSVFIALDMELLSRMSCDRSEQVAGFVESLSTGLPTPVKVIASASSFDHHFLVNLQESGGCIRLRMDDRRKARCSSVRERRRRPDSRVFG